jgi:hypothetical protein
LLQSQEEERTRIARELHDSVGQQWSLIKIKSQNIDEKEITTLTDNALEDVWSISRGVAPNIANRIRLNRKCKDVNERIWWANRFVFYDGYRHYRGVFYRKHHVKFLQMNTRMFNKYCKTCKSKIGYCIYLKGRKWYYFVNLVQRKRL